MLTFLFDLDGVIYRDHDPLPGAAATVAALRDAGHLVLFATNNATRRRAEFIERLAGMGIVAGPDQVGTSASATAQYLLGLPTPPTSALVIGSEALQAELREVGIRSILAEDDAETREQPDCVVVSLDRQFTYAKLAAAQRAVLSGAALVVTNRDPQFPGADRLWPGAGSIVAAVEAACRLSATAIGKPGPLLYQALLRANGAEPSRAIAIGDSLQTDIAAAAAMSMPSVLVLTGVSRRSDVQAAPAKPSLIIETLSELLTADLDALFAPHSV